MAPNAEDLAKRLAALSERFTTLAATLAQATQQVQAGTVPSETVIDEITKIRTDFVEVRQRVLEEARSDRKSTRLNSSHVERSNADFCLKKKKEVVQRVSRLRAMPKLPIMREPN